MMKIRWKQIGLSALIVWMMLGVACAGEDVAKDNTTVGTDPQGQTSVEDTREETLPSEDPSAITGQGNILAQGKDGAVWQVVEEDGKCVLYLTSEAITAIPNHNVDGGDPSKYPQWYEYQTQIDKIWVDKDIARLGNQIFYGCSNLTEVVFEEGSMLNEVGNGTFRNCTALPEITFGDHLVTIGNNTFVSCHSLTKLDFGRGSEEGVSFGKTTLKFCSNLETLVMPEIFLTTGENPFYQIHKLKDIYWYGSDMNVYQAMMANPGLDGDYLADADKNVYLWDEVTDSWTAEAQHPGVTQWDNGTAAWHDCTGEYGNSGSQVVSFYGQGAVGEYTVPAGVTTVVLMEGITDISAVTFENPKGITAVVHYGTEVVTGEDMFPNAQIEWRKNGAAGDHVTYALEATDDGYTLVLSGSGDMADMGAGRQPWWHVRHSITAVEVEEGVTSIGAYAFDRLRSMSSLTMPKDITMVSTYALRGCTSLTEVAFADGLENIGCGAFSGSANLQTIHLPASLQTVDIKAFEYCTGLKQVQYDGYEYQWSAIAIDMSSNLNDSLVLADITCLPTPQITDYRDAAASEYAEALQYLYARQMVKAGEEDAFGTELPLTDEEVLAVLYLQAGADSQYADALDWAKKNGLVDPDYMYGQMTGAKLQTLLTTVAEYNGSEYSFAEAGTEEPLTRAEGLSVVSQYLQHEAGTANRYHDIVAVLKEVLAAGGDGTMYVIAPNIFVENLGKKVGDCTFLIFPDGQTMLIDAGQGSGVADAGSSHTSQALVKFLYDIGLTRLDYLVLSHGHGDHYGGMESVVRYLRNDFEKDSNGNAINAFGDITKLTGGEAGTIGQFWLSGSPVNGQMEGVYSDTTCPALVEYITTQVDEVQYMFVEASGETFDIAIGEGEKQVTVTVFGPTRGDILTVRNGSTGDEAMNNTSLCLKFAYGESVFLACGDTYMSQERELVAAFAGTDFLQADVVKANHHGNYQSNGQDWIGAVEPKVFIAEIDGTGSGVVSTLVNNAGGVYYTTGFDGAVVVAMEKDGTYTVTTQYDGVLRKQEVTSQAWK